MTATVRSVRVVMEAEVAKYIADMKLAGRETRKAFDQANLSVSSTGKNFDAVSKSEQAVERDMARVSAQAKRTSRDLDDVGSSTRKVGKEIDTVSGRAHLLLDSLVLLGPALGPVGALAVPALAGLSGMLGASAASAVGAVIAFQGVGDALSALDKARIEPTAENLAKADQAMVELAPATQRLVKHLFNLRDEWIATRNVTAQGLFPGVNKGIRDLQHELPELQEFLFKISQESGSLFQRGAADITSDRWHDFFNYIDNTAIPLLDDAAESVGHVAHGLGELFAATAPSQLGFSGWLKDSAESFDEWADRVGETREFREFMAYVATNGPKVADAAGAIADAILQIVEAGAPLGGPTLDAITAVAHAVAEIADSGAGTPLLALASGMIAVNRAQRLLTSTGQVGWINKGYVQPIKDLKGQLPTLSQAGIYVGRFGQSQKYATEETLKARAAVRGFAKEVAPLAGKGAAGLAGLAIATSGVADQFGFANTASLALMGTFAGPWGAAVGGATGLVLDLVSANQTWEQTMRSVDYAIASNNIDQLRQSYADLSQQLAELQAMQNPDGLKDTVGALGQALGWWVAGAPDIDSRINDTSDALDQVRAHMDALSSAATNVLTSVDPTAVALENAARAAKSLNTELAVLNGWLDKRDALRNYQQSIDDFTASLKKNGKSFDINTQKGRDNQAALDQIATSIAQVAQQIQSPKKRANFINGAIDDLNTLASRSGPAARRQIQQVIDHLQTLNAKQANPSIKVNKAAAERDIDAVSARMAALRDRTLYVNVIQRQFKGQPMGGAVFSQKADGGTVPDDGGPYSDRFPYMLAPREEIVSDRFGGASKNRAALKAASSGAKLAVIGYAADGGTVGGATSILPAYRGHGGRSQLTGFGDWLSVAELGVRISNLTVAQIRGLGRELDDLGKKKLRGLGKALDLASERVKNRLDNAISKRDDIKQQASSYFSQVSGTFNHDLFGNGVAGLQTQLAADTNDANAMKRALQAAAKRGLSGGLLGALAASGDLNTAQQVSHMSASQIAQLERQYQARINAQNALGNYAVNNQYGAQMTAAQKSVDMLTAEVRELRRVTKSLKAEVREGAREGTKAGMEGKSRETAQRSRGGR